MNLGKEAFKIKFSPQQPKNEELENDKKIKFGDTEIGVVKNVRGPHSIIPVLIEPVEVEPEFLGGGFYGNVHKRLYKIVENGEEIILVKKTFRKCMEPAQQEIKEKMQIQADLKQAGIECLELYTDGKDLYSPLLNKDGIVALSGTPSHDEDDWILSVSNKERFEIDNLEELINKITDISKKSKFAEVRLSGDCLFFLKNNKDNNLDLIIGDYDLLKKDSDINLEYNSFVGLINNLERIITKYAIREKKEIYLKLIRKKKRKLNKFKK